MTVGEFKSMFSQYSPETVVTFGSSSYSRRPLVFFRTKIRGDKLLHIELTELMFFPHDADAQTPEPEHERRVTVGRLLQELNVGDDWELSFGGTSDASGLELKTVVPAVAVDLVQPDPPLFFSANSR